MRAASRAIPRRVKGAEASRFGADYVLLDATGKTLRGLNATAARVWELIDGSRTVFEIAQQISKEFEAPVEQTLEDVLAFLERIEGKQLVEVAPARD